MSTINRRDFLKISAVTGAGLVGAATLGNRLSLSTVTVEETRQLMGTAIQLKVVAPTKAEGRTAVTATFARIEELIAIFDHRDESSELGQLNAAGQIKSASDELIQVLQEAATISELTDGAFDVTVAPLVMALATGSYRATEVDKVSYQNVQITGHNVDLAVSGMAITLDGIAKGYIVDCAVEVLKDLGFINVLVEAGGDLAANGESESSEAWQIGVAHPRPEKMQGFLARFSLSNAAAATSGDYLNYFDTDRNAHHIVDPYSGRSPAELASVTTVAQSAMEADAWSTAFMVLGVNRSMDLIGRMEGLEALLVTKDLEVTHSPGFPS